MSRKELFRKMRKSKFFVIGGVVMLVLVLLCVLSPLFIVHDPYTSNLAERLLPPEYFANGWSGHVLGTDALGRDILTRLLIGGRYSLFVSVCTVAVTAVVGVTLGIVAGYFGGWVDTVIMRFAEVQSAIPTMVLAIAVISILGNSTFNLIMVLVITRWIQYTRMVRGQVMSIRRNEFVSAAKVLGASKMWIMFREILPNVTTTMIVQISMAFGSIILTEPSMSFLGLGIPAPAPSWGGMIADGREYLSLCPWVVVCPGIILMLAVLGFNFLGDGLRDVLDPKNKD